MQVVQLWVIRGHYTFSFKAQVEDFPETTADFLKQALDTGQVPDVFYRPLCGNTRIPGTLPKKFMHQKKKKSVAI